MKKTLMVLLTLITVLITSPAFALNRVLSLDGDGDYVEISDSESLNVINSQVTMEAWIKATAFPNQWNFILFKGDKRTSDACENRSYVLQLNSSGFIHLASAPSGGSQVYLNSPSVIALNRWYHVAGVIDAKRGVMKIFINGAEVASGDLGRNIHVSSLPLRIGWTHEEEVSWHAPFAGQIDEVRIWNIVRTQEEMQRTMHTTLSGKERGLVGYWRFEDVGKVATDSSPHHSDGKLVGDAHCVEAELPKPGEVVIPTVLSGISKDEAGKPIPNASVSLEQDGKEIAQAQADASGNYRIAIFQKAHGQYDLSATSEELGDWQFGIRLREGEQRMLSLTLKKAISIEGTLLMLDDKTPHVAVVVQAVLPLSPPPQPSPTRGEGEEGRGRRVGERSNSNLLSLDGRGVGGEGVVVATTLSDKEGKYRFINVKPGRYQVRCYPGKYLYFGQKASAMEGTILHVKDGASLKNIDFRFPPFKKGTWKTYTYLDGLAGNTVHAIYSAPDGTLWFGTRGGVSRYDGKEFVSFTTQDGLAHNDVRAICGTPDGILWFGTRGGVSRYDGGEFKNFTTKDGLANNYVTAIHRAPDGVLWFGTGYHDTPGGGVSRYDGKEFKNFTTKNGLAGNTVLSINSDPNGAIWFATHWEGLSRYDGKEFKYFISQELNLVIAIHCAPDGTLWFGTGFGGVSRFDGKELKNFTIKDGLLNNWVSTIHAEPDGVIWLGTGPYAATSGGGVSRYDGKSFVNVTTEDGLAYDRVISIYRAPDGALWFGTDGGGVSRYDEEGIENLTTKNGLAHNSVRAIYRAKDGVLWFGTQGGGVSRYDGKEFNNFTTKDGLAHNNVWSISPLPDGALCFGTGWLFGGVSRYDGKNFEDFTVKVGLPRVQILAVHGASDGTMWFGTWTGAFQYNGKKLVSFLAGKIVWAIHQAPDGALWFATQGSGVFRYDGKEFKNFTEEDGLADNWAFSIHADPDGVLWFGTEDGVSRYDGKKFVNFTQKDGLAGSEVRTIYRDFDGMLWFGTSDGGVSCYDGVTWTSLDTRDGLAGNSVTSIYQDPDGSLWFGTDRGVTHYRRNTTTPPKVHIVSVTTDKTYRDLSAIPAFTLGTRATIAYDAIDFKTIPEKRQYRCRIKEIDKDWRQPTKAASFDYTFDKPGVYTFEVQAIDRDLNYSEPATLTLQVNRPWWVFALFGTIGISIPLVALGFYFGKRLQTQRAIAQQFNPYIAGRVVEGDMFFGRNDLITDIERTLHNNCFLIYGERRIGKTSLQHQLRERLQKADDPTYRFIPAYIDLQGVAEDDFFRTIAASVVEQTVSLFTGGREALSLRLDEGNLTDRLYSYRDFTRDLRTIIDHLKENEAKTIKLVLLMDEVDTLNTYSLRTNLNLRGLFMGPLKENLVLVMSGLYLKMDWSDEGGGSPPFNFLSREIQLQPLDEASARKLITEPVRGFYSYESQAVDLIIKLSDLRPFTIQGFCLRAVNRVLAAGRTRITAADIEAIKASVLTEVESIRGERSGTSLPASLNEALSLIADLEAELAKFRREAA